MIKKLAHARCDSLCDGSCRCGSHFQAVQSYPYGLLSVCDLRLGLTGPNRELFSYPVCMFRVLCPVSGLYNSLPYTASAAIAGREVVFRWPQRGLQRPGRILTW